MFDQRPQQGDPRGGDQLPGNDPRRTGAGGHVDQETERRRGRDRHAPVVGPHVSLTQGQTAARDGPDPEHVQDDQRPDRVDDAVDGPHLVKVHGVNGRRIVGRRLRGGQLREGRDGHRFDPRR